MVARVIGERDSRHGGVPGFPQGRHAGRRAAWMGHNAATGRDNQVGRPEPRIGAGGLLGGLARREDRHDSARLTVEQRRQAGTGGRDHALVGLSELALQSIDMHVVGAGKTPDLLPRHVGPAEQRMPGEIAPAIAMRVDRQFAEPGQLDHPDEPDRIQARHQAGSAVL
jgi:hypothetical protein